jgi:hypothetical protein
MYATRFSFQNCDKKVASPHYSWIMTFIFQRVFFSASMWRILLFAVVQRLTKLASLWQQMTLHARASRNACKCNPLVNYL